MTTDPVPPEERTVGPAGPTADVAATDVMTRGELQDRAIKGTLWTLVHVAVSLPLAFAVNILIARTLGVVDFGRLAYLTTVVGLVATVIDLGVGTGVVQFGSKAHAAGRFEEVKRILTAAQGFRLLVGVPVITTAVILLVDVDPMLMAIAVVFGVVLPCALGGAEDSLGIENKSAQGAQATMIVNFATQVLVVIAATTVGTADSIWAVRVIAGGLGALVFLGFVARRYRRALLRPRFRRFPPGFWKFALPAGAAGMIDALVSSRSEVLVLTWMSATEAAGVFALAFGLSIHLYAPAQAMVGPLVPAISGLREVDVDAVGRALSRTLRASSTAMAPIVAAAMPAFTFLVPLIYGEEFSDVPEVLLALGVSGGILLIAGPIRAFVMARLKGVWMLWMNLVALAVSLGLMVLLIPHLGVWGAVVANVSSAAVLFGLLLVTEVRAVGIGAAQVFRDVTPFLLAVVVCGASWWGTSWLAWGAVPSTVVAGLSGAVLLVAAMRLTRSGLTPEDAEAVGRALPRRLRRVFAVVFRILTTVRRPKELS